jgi:hypothetical protein
MEVLYGLTQAAPLTPKIAFDFKTSKQQGAQSSGYVMLTTALPDPFR